MDLYLDREAFPEAFAADVDPETAGVMAATQRPWSGAGAATLGPARVAVHPVVVPAGHRDRAIPPAGQRRMAERGNARIEEVAACTRPWCRSRRPTRLILSAVETSRSQP